MHLKINDGMYDRHENIVAGGSAVAASLRNIVFQSIIWLSIRLILIVMNTYKLQQIYVKRVLRPLVNELKYLQLPGIELQINIQLLNYKAVIIALTGDNLFLNGILGYVESFTA